MYLIREVMYCKPGKVRPMVEKFQEMSRLQQKAGWGGMRILTDFAAERYWTIVAEIEVPDLAKFEASMRGEGMSEEIGKEMEKAMKGYHDLIEFGKREIYKIES